jgi:integrase/recombinase XerD
LEELEIRNLAYHTGRWYKENLHCVKLALEKLNLSLQPINLTEKDIKECILYWKRDCQHSPTTINHRIRSLKQLFLFLISESIVNVNPTYKLEKLKTPKVIIQPFSEEQLRKLLDQPDKSAFVGFRDYTIMLILLDCGVRLIELLNMKTNDVKLKNNTIKVLGKGAKEREGGYVNSLTVMGF